MENAWPASQRVRLKSDPGKNGVLTGYVQERINTWLFFLMVILG